MAALRFLCRATPGMAEGPERIVCAREARRMPVLLSADEVLRRLTAVPSLKVPAALTTAYAAGLRVAEVTSLWVADIESDRMMIRIEQAKGRGERQIMLAA